MTNLRDEQEQPLRLPLRRLLDEWQSERESDSRPCPRRFLRRQAAVIQVENYFPGRLGWGALIWGMRACRIRSGEVLI